MMAVVMKLCGDAFGRPTDHDGEYLKSFDFEAHDGVGEIVMTPDIQMAKMFDNFQEAFEFWRKTPECRPTRDDGKPNRPLTSTNWEFMEP